MRAHGAPARVSCRRSAGAGTLGRLLLITTMANEACRLHEPDAPAFLRDEVLALNKAARCATFARLYLCVCARTHVSVSVRDSIA